MLFAAVILALCASAPTARQDPPVVEREWLARDLERVAQLKRFLGRDVRSVEALREDLGGCDVREDRETGFGSRRLCLAVYGGHTTIWIRVLAAAPTEEQESLVASLELEQRGYRESWAGVAAELKRAWGSGVSDLELGLRVEWSDPTRTRELLRRTATALGGVLAVEPPRELAAAFATLVDPLSPLIVGRSYGDDGGAPPGLAEMAALIASQRFDLVRAVLRGPNPEARVYAAHALIQRGPLDPADAAAIATLAKLPLDLECSHGCLLQSLRWTAALAVLDED